MRDPLNFFEPFESLAAWHENQLTRAFLVVCKYVPIAHQSWLRRVSDGRDGAPPLPPLHELPAASFHTQTSSLGETPPPEDGDSNEQGYVAVSVIQAGEPGPDADPAGVSERRGIYDGVVRYGDDLVVVIESKLHGRVDERQSTHINVGETAWRLDPRRAKVRWRDVIADWRDLLVRDLVAGAERRMIEDFLWFAQRNFDRLQPFSELAVCRGTPHLLELRCEALLADAGPGETATRGGRASLLLEGARAVKLAWLGSDEWNPSSSDIVLSMYPGDTLEQAQHLYTRADAADRVLALRRNGWEVLPNFHFGHMSKGFAWTTTTLEVDSYVEYWRRRISTVGQVKRAEWPSYYDSLVRDRIATVEDREAFDEAFTHTQRQSATPRPGLVAVYRWPFERAAELDARKRFAPEVRDAINDVLGALGEEQIIRDVEGRTTPAQE